MQDPNDNKTASLLDNLPPQGFRGVAPPMVGWYNAKRVSHFDAPWSSRRWWNGTGWSMPCSIGASDEEALHARNIPAIFRPGEIEWMGLAVPDTVTGYHYALEAKTNEEAFALDVAGLVDQAAACELVYGKIAQAWKAHADDVGHDVTQQRLEAHAASTRRVFKE